MTTETLMTGTDNTTQGTASSPDATSAAPVGGTPAATTPGASSQQATEGQTTEGDKSEGTKAEGDKAAPTGAPEKYEFVPPEGKEFSPEVLAQFSEVAKELNMTQEAAQKVIDKIAPALAEKQSKALEAARTEWADTSKSDKEFGGDKLNENMAIAKKALEQFGSPELRTLLNESGLGNHPELIRMMYRAGKAISEDNFVQSGQGGKPIAKSNNDYANSLYPAKQ
jgi:hypothetical protein